MNKKTKFTVNKTFTELLQLTTRGQSISVRRKPNAKKTSKRANEIPDIQ